MVSALNFQTEKRDATWCVVVTGAEGFRKEIVFDGPYEPARADVGDIVIYWSGNQLAALDPGTVRDHRLHYREFIQYVLPIDSDRAWVVADTYVNLIDVRTWREESVVNHDEIFREVNWDGRLLTLRDLQGRDMRIAVPEGVQRDK